MEARVRNGQGPEGTKEAGGRNAEQYPGPGSGAEKRHVCAKPGETWKNTNTFCGSANGVAPMRCLSFDEGAVFP